MVKGEFPPRIRALRCVILAACAVALAGCSSNPNTLGAPASTGGASTVSQARGEAPGTPPPAYPAVHDMPAPRNSTILTDYEQKQLENDLAAARRKVAPEAEKPAAKRAAPQKTGNKQDP
mgnify:CR=1 FL=1